MHGFLNGISLKQNWVKQHGDYSPNTEKAVIKDPTSINAYLKVSYISRGRKKKITNQRNIQVRQKMKKVLDHVNYMKINKIFSFMHSASETFTQ